MPNFDLSGRVAIVTGATQGIGRGIALTLADAGADIVVVSRDPGRVASTVGEVEKRGRRALGVPTDVTVPEQVERMAAAAIDTFGRVDILVNNAGGNVNSAFRRAPLLDLTLEEWQACLAFNLTSVFLCSRAVVPQMQAQGKGVIINVGSGHEGEPTRPGFSAYGAAKGGVARLTNGMAAEWGPTIRVVCVVPGFVDNPKPTPGRTPAAVAERVKSIATGRIGQPEDIGNAVVFLASDAASWVDGVSLTVNGGLIAPGPSGLASGGAAVSR